MAAKRRTRSRPRRDWGRVFAFALCVVFALIGAIPLGLGLLVRTQPVRDWAARETSAILASELGVAAQYKVRVQAWPLSVELEDVVVDASDGGSPFLQVERITVRPRPFALLAAELDVGDVEVIGPRIRAVVQGGELKNLHYKLPESEVEPSAGPKRTPIASLEITDAHLDATIDGIRLTTHEVDVDVSPDEGSSFEVSLRAGATALTRVRPVAGREAFEDAVDEDVICRLDARVRIEPQAVLVRRLNLLGSADFDPDPGTAPACVLAEGDWRRVELRLGAMRVGLPSTPGEVPSVSGRLQARLPLPLVHRFNTMPHVSGSLGLDVEIDWDGKARLPGVTGHIRTESPGLDGKVFSKVLEADVTIGGETIRVTNLEAEWGDAKVTIAEAKIEPFAKGIPLSASPVDIRGMEFPGLLRDLGVHPQAHVAMTMREGHFDHFRGTLDPVNLEGVLVASVRGFEIFDRPTTHPARGHMMGVKEASLRGTFAIRTNGDHQAVVFQNFSIDTPRSHVRTTVNLDLREIADIEVFEGSYVQLEEISPLAAVTMGGKMSLHAKSHGPFDEPDIKAEIAIKDFVFAGFPVGEIERANAHFKPLVLTLTDARVKHNASRIKAGKVRVAFDEGADVIVDADIDTREPPHLKIFDFYEVFNFVTRNGDKAVWADPRFADIGGPATGSGTARVHFAVGGREDRCGGGFLDVRTQMRLTDLSLFGERYDDGTVDLDFIWDDQLAGDAGMRVDIRSASIRKGQGTILATGTVRHGGILRADAVATGIPIDKLDVFGPAGKMFDGTVSTVVSVGGTVSRIEALADVQVSRVRIGPDSLPPSRFRLTVEPSKIPPKSLGVTPICKNPRTEGFDPVEYAKDRSGGLFRASGQLFGGQIALDNVTVTQQRHKVVEGKVRLEGLDLGKLANLVPGVAFADSAPKGSLSASLDVKSFPLDDPKKAEMSLVLSKLLLSRSGRAVELAETSGAIELKGNELTVPDLQLKAKTSSGLSGTFFAGGTVHRVMTSPDLDLGVRVERVELAKISADIKQVARASGVADATLRVTGPPSSPRYSGAAHIRGGELDIKDPRLSLEAITVDVEIGDGDVKVTRATANVGGGTVAVTARLPVRGLEFGTATATITARGVRVPVADGVNMTANADIDATYRPGGTEESGERSLPDLKGTVSLTSFSYTRPIAMSVNLGQLTGKPQRTEVDTYNPDDEVVRFNLNVVSPKPLRFSNNLVDMQLEVVEPGLVLSGTNQRFGARGMLRILPDSKLQLRATEFEVREGFVRFDDASRIAPKVDVRATTEYRRYGSSGPEAGGAGSVDAAASGGAASNTSGQWRINLHAHGDADDLKVNLTSDPTLGQEDIVLLLTLGMTRAEVDRGLASSLGETVGLEALSALTGADKAVKTIVPLIDEFRFGTAYSSRTGRTEPTVTLGKRITNNLRANVTTGITENREIRSNLEWRLGKRVSVQGSYDNANDASSSNLGNVGVDLRWRIDFE